MTIVPLRKISICGPARDKQSAMERVQELGCLHLIELGARALHEEMAPAREVRLLQEAVDFLHGSPERLEGRAELDEVVLTEIAEEALDVARRMRAVEEERGEIDRRIATLEPWGEFDFPAIDDLAGYRLWFYVVPLEELEALPASEEIYFHEVRRDAERAWIVAMSRHEPTEMPVGRVHTGSRSLSELRRRRRHLGDRRAELADHRRRLTRWLPMLEEMLAEEHDRTELAQALERLWEDEAIFVVQGWVPRARLPDLRVFAGRHGLALVEERPEPGETPPTLLENPRPTAGGEQLVTFYTTPAYRAWDPSQIVFFSFAIFFAMILSDAGYAALLGLGLAWSWRRLGEGELARRMRNLTAWIVGLSVVWGVAVGSYFGYDPPQGTVFAGLKFLDMNDMNLMMKLSIVIGAAHLIMANLAAAWVRRRMLQGFGPLGWAMVVAGGLTAWFAYLHEAGVVQQTGYAVMAAGGLLVFLFGPGGGLSFWRRLAGGGLELTRITGAFGDVLSYLRLFALGLASVQLAVTFNTLSGQVAEAVPYFGGFLAALVFLIGHALNLILCIISGVVHGLRLNVIEFFNWALSDEGYPFRAFRKKAANTWNH